MSSINNPGSAADSMNVGGGIVTTPFSASFLVNGIGPVGEVEVNSFPVANNRPCMIEVPISLVNAQRTVNKVYYNGTGYPLLFFAYQYFSGSGDANITVTANIGTSSVPATPVYNAVCGNHVDAGYPVLFFVPAGYYYEITHGSATTPNLSVWREWICQNGAWSASSDLSGSRSSGTVYQNNSSSTLFVSVQCSSVSSTSTVTAVSDITPGPLNTVDEQENTSSSSGPITLFFLVPPYHYYKVTAASGSIAHWYEYTWSIPCTKSADLVLTTGQGQSRTGNAYSASLNSGASNVTCNVPQMWINDPFRVRWVQIICANSAADSQQSIYTDAGLPPYTTSDSQTPVTGSAPCTVKCPVMPGMIYMFTSGTSGTLTVSHWWEYQLG